MLGYALHVLVQDLANAMVDALLMLNLIPYIVFTINALLGVAKIKKVAANIIAVNIHASLVLIALTPASMIFRETRKDCALCMPEKVTVKGRAAPINLQARQVSVLCINVPLARERNHFVKRFVLLAKRRQTQELLPMPPQFLKARWRPQNDTISTPSPSLSLPFH